MSDVATRTDTLENSLERDLEAHRRELTAYCYRMLGSGSEAEDAVQETLLRAWRKHESFEGRSSLRSWLYRIATNVCLDMLQGSQRRARPMDLNSPVSADSTLDAGLPEQNWVLPIADSRVLPADGDPAELAAERETIKLAFVAALQHLPPKQRAVLILREVLRWKADEVAELLDTSTPSVNSALQRARATLDSADVDLESTTAAAVDGEDEELLARYVDAFERYDIAALVSLIREDATFSMPPYELWLKGPEEVGKWMLGTGIGCKGSKLLVTKANGRPAVGIYRPAEPGAWEPFNLCVLDFAGGQITAIHNFIFPELFPAFGLPRRIESRT
jgi:RNA polymerase sigma-70 factor, ECF subfamily